MSGQRKAPHHVVLLATLLEYLSAGLQVKALAKHALHAQRYLEQRHKLAGKSVAKTDGRIFIGHGRSLVWMQLKDFIHQKLELPYEEFNREAQAGRSIKEVLQAALDSSCFAFLVMTAEDDQADGARRARQNVIHEAGLFQGRYGFERAIILLEAGCEKFSNIDGLVYIEFPAGNVKAAFEDVRDVLRRERIIA